ncbi:MAG TPA: amidohydrolase family protein [Xanthobacteraceae bacterium]
MKKLLLAGSITATTALALCGTTDHAGAQRQSALVIQGGTLVDGNGGPPLANAVIVIQGNRITAVGAAGEVQVPASAQVINAAGKWITPGLIDAKANWNWMYGEAFLHWGVTTAMVTGARNDQGIAERDAVDHGIFPGPRLYQGFINLQGGGPDGQRPNNYKPGAGDRIVRSPEEARALVRYNIESGADFIGTNDGNGPPEVFAAIADEAHKAGKGVVMRCVGPQTRGKECVLAGADVMVHTGEIGDQISSAPEKWKTYVGLPPDAYCDMDAAKEQDMIAFLIAHDAAPEPDFMAADRGFPSMWKRVQQETRESFRDPNLLAYYPQFAIADVEDNQRSPEEYLTADQIKLRSCGYQNHAKFIGDLVAAGGQVVAASDITQTPPGLGLHQEMDVMQEDAHMPPMKVLQAATSWVAHHFRMKDIGSIEVGKLADIDIVNADPTIDIMNMRKLDTVIKDGKVVDRNYHPWFKGDMFSNSHLSYNRDVVDLSWEQGLKAASGGRRGGGEAAAEPEEGGARQGARAAAAPAAASAAGGRNPASGVANNRRGGGFGAVPDPSLSPSPGIETLFPHSIIQGAPDTTFTLTGINFVRRSLVYANGQLLPTTVTSGTQLTFVIDANTLAKAGKLKIVVKNPEPLAAPEWGPVSNEAYLLVPFSFTTAWSHNKDVGDFQK